MAESKENTAEKQLIGLSGKKTIFKMENVPESQKIIKKDKKLVGEQITNCHYGNRYKLVILKIYTDKRKQLCIECVDSEFKRRTFLAEHCKLIKKPGIRKKKSSSSRTKISGDTNK